MGLFDNLALGFSTALSVQNLLFCLFGVLIGTLVGVLPGISPLNTTAMLLPFTFGLAPTSAMIMLAGIFIHIYLSTFGQPGTFHAMTRGVVSRAWAWTNHPAWYREVTGRDPRHDYEEARRRQTEQARRTPDRNEAD